MQRTQDKWNLIVFWCFKFWLHRFLWLTFETVRNSLCLTFSQKLRFPFERLKVTRVHWHDLIFFPKNFLSHRKVCPTKVLSWDEKNQNWRVESNKVTFQTKILAFFGFLQLDNFCVSYLTRIRIWDLFAKKSRPLKILLRDRFKFKTLIA